MKSYPSSVAVLLLLAVAGPAAAQNAETYRESRSEREACTPDVWRLCKRYIPSRSAIAGCLERSPDLSPACAAVMRGDGATAEARPPGRRDPRE